MTTQEVLLDCVKQLARTVATLDLNAQAAASDALYKAHPPSGMATLESAIEAGAKEGWLTPKSAGPDIRFGRVAKAGPQTHGMSVDVVDIEGEGMEHTHPKGEVSVCFARSGTPTFDGHEPGWVVLKPGSHHTPTVTGGRMIIIYFQPDGAVKWGPAV
jgi:hypothetical protein